jgi:WD domain, G-beta repeat
MGSGRVLTAAHNVGTGELLIRVGGDRKYRATIVASGSGEAADLALLEITDPPFGHELDPVRFAAVDRGSPEPVSGCWAVGFPRFKEEAQSSRAALRLRDSAHLRGEILPGANLVSGLLELQVTATPRPLPPGEVGKSEWQGISGAVVFATDDRLGYCAVGVVVEHHRPEGASSLTVVPITALETLGRAEERGRWWELLGVPDSSQLAVLPRLTEPKPPDYWATVEEIAQRAPVLLERDRELADLAAFATGTEGYRWLVGGPWAGKSALVAHFARACPPEVDCVAYFLVRRLSDADSGRFAAVVSTQLAWLLKQDAPPRLDDPDLFRSLWAQAVERAEQTGRHLLLVVDGLDEDLSHQLGPSVAALLPFRAGGRAHVLVTSRPYPEISGDVDANHPLRQVQPVVLRPSPHADALARRARQELDQLLYQRDGDELTVSLVALLAAAGGALSVHDLTELVSQSQAHVRRRQVERVVTMDIARLLQPTGVASAYRYTFAHDQLRDRTASELDDELPDYRTRVFTWAEGYRVRGWPAEVTPGYLFDAYPTLLAQQAADKLPALLTDLAYLDSAIARVGVDRIASHLHKVRGTGLAEVDPAAISWCLDQAAHHLRPPYLLDTPGYVIRHLCLQALKGGHTVVAGQARQQLLTLPAPRLIPRWTSRRASRALIRTFLVHTGLVRAVAITPDGTQAVSAGWDGTLRRWDLATGGQLGEPLTGHDRGVNAVAITPDGTQAISAGDDRTIRAWNLPSGRSVDIVALDSVALSCATANDPDGFQVLTGDALGATTAWLLPLAGAMVSAQGTVQTTEP